MIFFHRGIVFLDNQEKGDKGGSWDEENEDWRYMTGMFFSTFVSAMWDGGRAKMNRNEKCNVFVNETEVGGKCY